MKSARHTQVLPPKPTVNVTRRRPWNRQGMSERLPPVGVRRAGPIEVSFADWFRAAQSFGEGEGRARKMGFSPASPQERALGRS